MSVVRLFEYKPWTSINLLRNLNSHESDKDGVNDVSKVRQTYGRVDMSPTQEKI